MKLPLLVPDWPAPPNVRAAMTTRAGGVSSGPYASLNLGGASGDDPARVELNRQRLENALSLPSEPAWLQQVHGTRVVRLPGATPPLQADASYTSRAGTVCVVLAADCLPVLLCDSAGTVVAAAHAGWRGLAAGVLEETVRALPVPSGSLMAWMGAAIGPDAFEVGPEVHETFIKHDPAAKTAFKRLQTGKFMANLFHLARQRLADAGIDRVFGGGECTYGNAMRFFSHRRDGRCGRMAACIWLAALPHENGASG